MGGVIGPLTDTVFCLRYIKVLECLYKGATILIGVQDQRTKQIQFQRRVRKGDVISQKLLTNALEDMFKVLDGKEFVVNINSGHINYLRFADDVVILAESLEDFGTILKVGST